MIKYLDSQEKEWTRDLWREAFPEDSEEFLDYYYKEKMSDNWVLALFEDDSRVQSMLQRNPYCVQARNRTWNVDYLVAVATRSDRRHRGYMRSLLTRMMQDQHSQRMPFCFLMPAAEAIYTPFQFTFIYDQPVWQLKEDVRLHHISIKEENVSSAAEWMNQWLEKRYELYACRNEAYVRRLLHEVVSEDGSMEFLQDGDRLAGVQSIWGRETREQRLLYTEDGYSKLEKTKPAIMARIITPETFLPVIRLRQDAEVETLDICLELEDPMIADNNGCWIWTLNRETSVLRRRYEDPEIQIEAAGSRKKDRAAAEKPTVREAEPELDGDWDHVLHLRIEELTAWLFGYHVPDAVKQYAGAEQIDVLKRIFLDEVV